MEEVFKDIEGYEKLYSISNKGRIKSLNYRGTGKEKILKLEKDGNGYYRVILCKSGSRKRFKVHRLVAKAFIPNPNNYPIINHKDENPSNNAVENLEWCTMAYNNTYNNRHKKIGEKLKGRKHSEEHKKKISKSLKSKSVQVIKTDVQSIERELKIKELEGEVKELKAKVEAFQVLAATLQNLLN